MFDDAITCINKEGKQSNQIDIENVSYENRRRLQNTILTIQSERIIINNGRTQSDTVQVGEFSV